MIAFLILFLVLPLVIASSSNGWSKTKRADAEYEFVFRIDLIIRNVNHLETLFWQISNPDSPSFRKYLSSDEISAIIAPSTNKFGQVIEWLTCSKLLPFSELKQNSTSENNKVKDREIICYQSIYKDFIYVKSTVSTIEKFFNLELSEYNLQNNDRNLVPTEVTLTRADTVDATLLIPANLHSVISRIYGITELPPLDTLLASATASGLYRKHRRGHDVATQAREPGDQITPPVIWKTYGLDAVLPLNASLLIGSASCAEFQDEEFLQTDVAKFETLFGLADVKVDIIGANNGGYFGEGSLDTEYLTGTAPGLGVTWIGIPWGSSFTSDLFEWTQVVLNMPNPPLVHEVSWGAGETGSASYDIATVTSININFQIMGLRGLTVLVASGDSGTSATTLCRAFDPTFPASSPYVTAVGGTYLQDGVEVGWSSSGGGFSNVFPRPSYQDTAVLKYLTDSVDLLPTSSLFNSSGRAFPDIAAFATNFLTVSSGGNYTVSGTSASTPVVAGVMALLNAVLLSRSQAPLGFINPSLYALYGASSVGYDVVTGNNLHKPCSEGFSAAVGWDPISGLGTPLWNTLQRLLDPRLN